MTNDTLNKLPTRAKALWSNTYKEAVPHYGESRAAKIAWTSLKNKFTKVENNWVARFKDTPDYTTVHYVLEASEDSVARSIDGMIYRDFVLTSKKDVFSDFALKRMVEQINEEGLVGRADKTHDEYHDLFKKSSTPEEVEEELQKVKSGIEAIKASYDGNKLVATIKMTPEAYAKAKDYNAASIEARMPKSSLREGIYHQARLMGFVLTDQPDNPDAVAVS